MQRVKILLVTLASSLAAGGVAFGHGTPIDIFADSSGKLYAQALMHEGTLSLVGGTLITTTLPGFGVSTTSNGLTGGDEIGFDVTQKLLYWNGSEVTPTTAQLLVENPDLDESYLVTDSTGLQQGLHWATYSGAAGWHAHGDYTLSPNSAAAGVYGLVIRLTSPDYEPSDEILIAFNYGLSHDDYLDGVAAIQEAMAVPEPSTLALLAIGGAAVVLARRGRRTRHRA